MRTAHSSSLTTIRRRLIAFSSGSAGSGGKTINLSFLQRVAFLLGLLITGLLGVGVLEPIPQEPSYHLFADTRTFFGVPNFNDVVSNAGFAVVGILGMVILAGEKRRTIFFQPPDARPYTFFFVGVVLVSLGSAYYHWAPSNERLLWDRLPMSIGFMAFSSAVVADRIHARAGNGWVLFTLIAAGIASLVYWHWTESLGRGDLRFYALVQFYPILALPFVYWLFPRHRYTAGRYLIWVILWYGLSKALEHFDGEVFDFLGHAVSGHPLKHLAAAVSTYVVLSMLLARRSTSV